MEPLVQLSGVTVTLGGNRILNDITLNIPQDSFVALIGPNGAGKTTLIRCMAGLQPIRSGDLLLKGRRLKDWTAKERARTIGYVPQAVPGPIPFNVEEFLLLARYPHLSPFTTVSSADRDAVHQALRQTDTEGFETRSMETLSGGERQRVLIAAALVQEADLLLLDEPTNFLDYKHRGDVLALMRRLHREHGLTVLAAMHDLNAALACADRIVALKTGECVRDESPRTFLDTQGPDRIFDVPFDRLTHDGRPWLVSRPSDPRKEGSA